MQENRRRTRKATMGNWGLNRSIKKPLPQARQGPAGSGVGDLDHIVAGPDVLGDAILGDMLGIGHTIGQHAGML
jgi:hypothetical protein